jgi:hypothetical protein
MPRILGTYIPIYVSRNMYIYVLGPRSLDSQLSRYRNLGVRKACARALCPQDYCVLIRAMNETSSEYT